MPSTVCKGSLCPYRTCPAEGSLHRGQTRTLNIFIIPLQSPSLSWWVCKCLSMQRSHNTCLHSADTFTTFWWGAPTGRWASPSGVITGGVGMLMIAVVIWLLWQFRGACSSTRMFRLERLNVGKKTQNNTSSPFLIWPWPPFTNEWDDGLNETGDTSGLSDLELRGWMWMVLSSCSPCWCVCVKGCMCAGALALGKGVWCFLLRRVQHVPVTPSWLERDGLRDG